MGSGQTMLTVLAMVLLSFLMLRVNNLNLETTSTLNTTKFEVLAFSLAESMIQEIEANAFDENTTTAVVSSPSSLSTVLGPENGETFATYDDIDDFNNYTRTDTIPAKSGVIFNIRCKVDYVSSASPDVATSTKSWHKMITVYVTSPFMIKNALSNQYYLKVKSTTAILQDTVKLSQVYSYWNFK
jgi:MSHA pilin protein MshD